jgi:hypothetical protein
MKIMNKIKFLALLISIVPAATMCMNENGTTAAVKEHKKRNILNLSVIIPSETSLEESIPSETPPQEFSKMDLACARLARVQNQLPGISMQKELLQILDDIEALVNAESPDDSNTPDSIKASPTPVHKAQTPESYDDFEIDLEAARRIARFKKEHAAQEENLAQTLQALKFK